MKLELVKETEFNKEPWYSIYLNERYVFGGHDKERIDGIFAEAVCDPENYFKTTKEVLKSAEIIVNL